MLLTWLRVGVELRLVVRAMLTPLETILPAALTRLIARAFCSAAPDKLTMEDSLSVTFDPSSAMFCAEAELKLVGPFTVSMTWLLRSNLLELLSVFSTLRFATALLLMLLFLVTFALVAKLLVAFAELLLELFLESADCEAELLPVDHADCDAFAAVALEAAFADRDASELRLSFELEFREEDNWPAELEVVEAVLDAS